MKQINLTTLDYKILNNFRLLNERIVRDDNSTKRNFGLFEYKANSNEFSIKKTYYDTVEFYSNFKTKINFDKDIQLDFNEFSKTLNIIKENPNVYYFKNEDDYEFLIFKYGKDYKVNLGYLDIKKREIETPKIDRNKLNFSFKITPRFFEQLEYSSRKLRNIFDFEVSHISNDKSKLVYTAEHLGKVTGIKSYEFKVDSDCKNDFKITLTRRQHKVITKLLVSNYTASLYENKYLILKNDFVPLEYVFILISEEEQERLRIDETKGKRVEPKPTPDSNKSEEKQQWR